MPLGWLAALAATASHHGVSTPWMLSEGSGHVRRLTTRRTEGPSPLLSHRAGVRSDLPPGSPRSRAHNAMHSHDPNPAAVPRKRYSVGTLQPRGGE